MMCDSIALPHAQAEPETHASKCGSGWISSPSCRHAIEDCPPLLTVGLAAANCNSLWASRLETGVDPMFNFGKPNQKQVAFFPILPV
jgi:hypothetical protein